jgi:predicted lipoprotein with Yx(FWY)xxD motif
MRTTITSRAPKHTRLLVALAVASLGVTACGGDSESADGTGATASAASTTAATAAPSAASLGTTDTSFGTIVTDANGLTLYMFVPDEAGTPTCTGGCAEAWPPATASGTPTAPAAIDSALLTTVEHPSAGNQLKLGAWPLYRFAGDAAPGDVNGQGSGGNWFVIGVDGKPIKG